MFDLAKLNDISKNVISVMDADTVLKKTEEWAKNYNPEFYDLIEADRQKMRSILNIDRENAKPRKDISRWADVPDYVSYFYGETYCQNCDVLPESISKKDAVDVLKAYKQVFDINDDKDTWFQKIKDLCEPLGFTPNVKEYKANPENFKGHVGDVSTIIRVALTSRTNTPDLHAIMAVLGKTEVNNRFDAAIADWEK